MFKLIMGRRMAIILMAAAGLFRPGAVSADLDPECVMRLAESAADAMTMAQLREKCLLPSPIADGVADSAEAKQKPAVKEDTSPLSKRLAIERDTVVRPFSILAHKPNYLLAAAYNDRGWSADVFREAFDEPDYDHEDLEAQFQLSLKLPVAIGLFGDRLDVYGAYTNRSFWQVYNEDWSRPFRETNHEPEFWGQFRNDWSIFGFTNTLNAIGFVHQSNGRGGLLSRSWNRVYANFIFEKGRWAIGFKPWLRINEDREDDDNPDITDFLGHGELRVAYQRDRHVFSMMTRNQVESGFDEGALELSWSFPVFDYPYLKGYIQYFNGYGESLIDYNQKVNRIGIGIILTDWLD